MLPEPSFEIVELKGGVKSLRMVENQETFHPGIGPLAEARILHVDQQRLCQRLEALGRLVVWDVGLGAAANAVAALDAVKGLPGLVEIHSFDQTLSPLRFALKNTDHLSYLSPYQDLAGELLRSGSVTVTPRLRWHLHLGDFRDEMLRPDLPLPHAIFYDPYSPRSNVEMWTLEHFCNLRRRLGHAVPCLLSNYTRSRPVRVTLLMAGFVVGVGTAIGEKEETTLASNDTQEILRPLARDFLEGTRVSPAGSPLRGSVYATQAIGVEDFAALAASEQFRQTGDLGQVSN